MAMLMSKRARWAAIIAPAGFICLWLLSYAGTEPPPDRLHDQAMPPGLSGSVAIADVREALTFARYHDGEQLHLMRVTRYEGEMVEGVLLAGGPPDPIALFNAEGYDALAGRAGPPARVPAVALLTPFDGTDNQIAMGGNYPAHSAETELEEPFLFPKLLRPDPWRSGVGAGDGLLDYELELGFVALTDLTVGSRPQTMGLVLAADYTDRALLLRRLNLLRPEAGDGFTDAKSLPGYMPVGNLLVIPRDLRRFYAGLHLRLFVDGQLRQVARPRDMIWQIDRMLDESLARAGMSWPGGVGAVRLPITGGGVLPARTILLSGTTDGVVFRPPGIRQIYMGAMETLFAPWHWPSWRDRLVEAPIREARAAGHYLQPGQQVVMHADGLGIIHSRVIKAP